MIDFVGRFEAQSVGPIPLIDHMQILQLEPHSFGRPRIPGNVKKKKLFIFLLISPLG